jgi:tetratricopeptide (TPR) repeat protein
MKKALFLFLILAASLGAFAQNTQPQNLDLTKFGVRIEPDKRLIVVLASLEAAGVETPLTQKGAEFRQKLQADLKDLDKELVDRMKLFIKQYKTRRPNATDAELVSPFISMAYALSPVPELAEPARTTDLPGDLLEVLDFSPLVREFYRRSAVRLKLDQYVKDYNDAGDALRVSTEQMVRELLDYMHTKPKLVAFEKVKVEAAKGKKSTLRRNEFRERERRFFIVPELLASKGTINFINVGEDYYAILPPETNLRTSEVRNAYLQFVIDPLILDNAKQILTFRDGIKALLDERRKENGSVSPDVFLAVLRSLVAAVDARQTEFEKTRLATSQARQKIDLMKTDADKIAVSRELNDFKKTFSDETALQLSEAYERGAVLAFYFADALKGTEDSGFDIASSLRDIILSIDTTKETNRLAQFTDARKRAEDRRKNPVTQPKVIENPVTVKLLAIDKIVTDKNYPAAETELKKLLAEYPTESARIYYAIGRVSSLSAEGLPKEEIETRNRRLLEAKVAYTNVIRSVTAETDPALLSLSYVGLGRIYEFYDETEYAVKIYEVAIKIGDVTGGAYKEAVEAKERLAKKSQ